MYYSKEIQCKAFPKPYLFYSFEIMEITPYQCIEIFTIFLLWLLMFLHVTVSWFFEAICYSQIFAIISNISVINLWPKYFVHKSFCIFRLHFGNNFCWSKGKCMYNVLIIIKLFPQRQNHYILTSNVRKCLFSHSIANKLCC